MPWRRAMPGLTRFQVRPLLTMVMVALSVSVPAGAKVTSTTTDCPAGIGPWGESGSIEALKFKKAEIGHLGPKSYVEASNNNYANVEPIVQVCVAFTCCVRVLNTPGKLPKFPPAA